MSITWSHTPKTGFLATKPTWFLVENPLFDYEKLIYKENSSATEHIREGIVWSTDFAMCPIALLIVYLFLCVCLCSNVSYSAYHGLVYDCGL